MFARLARKLEKLRGASGRAVATSGAPAAQKGSVSVREIPGLHRLFPQDPRHQALLALEVARRGDSEQALGIIDVVERESGRSAELTLARARVHAFANDHAKAVSALRALPAGAMTTASETLRAEYHYLDGDYAAADAAFARVLELNPHAHAVLLNRASTLARLGRLEEAASSARRSLRYDPRSVDARYTLAWAQTLAGEYVAALETIEGSLRLFPRHAESLMFRGMTRLLLGDHEAGWQDFEARAHLESNGPLRRSLLARPRWEGEPLGGRRVLVFGEQGAGDILMMARYLPAVRERGGRVLFEGPESLHELVTSAGGVEQCVPRDMQADPAEPFDLWIPMMSLPRLLGGWPRTAARVPYLAAPDDARGFWRELLAADRGPRVGLAWSGNPGHVSDFFRSMQFADLAPLLGVRGVAFYALQLQGLDAARRDGRVRDVSEHLVTFADTAALVHELDLVIAVDTSVVHIAGALGKEAWLMLPFNPDWRWGLGASETPWYPSLRLFRQPKPLDWSSTVASVRTALQKWIGAREAAAVCAVEA